MTVINLRLMRELWHQNPPSLVVLFGIVVFVVGYAWRWALGGTVLPALGIALLLAGGGYEIVWLHRRRKRALQS